MRNCQRYMRHDGRRNIPRNHNRCSPRPSGTKVRKLLISCRIQVGILKTGRIREPIGGDVEEEGQGNNSFDHFVPGWEEYLLCWVLRKLWEYLIGGDVISLYNGI